MKNISELMLLILIYTLSIVFEFSILTTTSYINLTLAREEDFKNLCLKNPTHILLIGFYAQFYK